jgi:hypothetical protein
MLKAKPDDGTITATQGRSNEVAMQPGAQEPRGWLAVACIRTGLFASVILIVPSLLIQGATGAIVTIVLCLGLLDVMITSAYSSLAAWTPQGRLLALLWKASLMHNSTGRYRLGAASLLAFLLVLRATHG